MNDLLPPEPLQATEPLRATESPFEEEAATYDASFTHSLIGSLMRQAVWHRLDVLFPTGSRILELGCGTGEDAAYLARRGNFVLATDPTLAMVEATRKKAEDANLADHISTRQLRFEDLQAREWTAEPTTTAQPTNLNPRPFEPPFDGALSNFGGLNCVADLPATAHGLAQWLRPGAQVGLCVMGPCVPWEWLWHLLHGHPRTAFRRWRRGGVKWRGLTVHYPSIRTLRRAFEPSFRTCRVSAIGALLPPSYVEPWAAHHPALIRQLDRWERRMETWFPLPWLADHYLIELERR